ncbi:hypothetical protein CJ030_MR2G002666 [Morella rubra]|uniref:Uncharacterized protein n=1 Tax=Morella rubra TaxID=262757 RepID=A0A6A1WD14_9ROSI|nr:hypothetical protein CJ030_MR2G002666 [Morella rubra]
MRAPIYFIAMRSLQQTNRAWPTRKSCSDVRRGRKKRVQGRLCKSSKTRNILSSGLHPSPHFFDPPLESHETRDGVSTHQAMKNRNRTQFEPFEDPNMQMYHLPKKNAEVLRDRERKMRETLITPLKKPSLH